MTHEHVNTHLQLESFEFPIQCLAVSPSGAIRIYGDVERNVFVYQNDALAYSLKLGTRNLKLSTLERIRNISFSSDESQFYVVCGDRIEAFRVSDGKRNWISRTSRMFGFLGVLATAAAPSHDGRVAYSFDNGQFGIRDSNGTKCRSWRDNSAPRWMAFDPTGETLIGSDGFTVIRWDSTTGEVVRKISFDERVYALTGSSVFPVFAVRGLHQVTLYIDDEPIATVRTGEGLPTLKFAHSSEMLAYSDLHSIHVVNFEGKEIHTICADDARILTIEFGSGDETILASFSDGSVRTFALETS